MRNPKSKLSALAFAIIGTLFIAPIASKMAFDRVFGIIIVFICSVGVFRGLRSGYLAISDSAIFVRTLFRTTTFKLEAIKAIEPLYLTQATKRICPQILLKDGGKYRLSEFFVSRRIYDKGSARNIVNKVISQVDKRLSARPPY